MVARVNCEAIIAKRVCLMHMHRSGGRDLGLPFDEEYNLFDRDYNSVFFVMGNERTHEAVATSNN